MRESKGLQRYNFTSSLTSLDRHHFEMTFCHVLLTIIRQSMQQLLDCKVWGATFRSDLRTIKNHKRKLNIHGTLGVLGVGRSRCMHKLSDKWVGAGKVVHLQGTNHQRFSKQGLGLVSKKW